MGYWISPELDALAAVFGYGLLLYLFWQYGIRNFVASFSKKPGSS